MALARVANLEELEPLARPLLPISVYGYYSSGSGNHVTMGENRTAWNHWRLLPRFLVDVSKVDTSTTVFGIPLAFPVMVAPMAAQRLCHPDGEVAMARGAAAAGVGCCLSTIATTGMEEFATVSELPGKFMQMYVMRRRKITIEMVRDAERFGFDGLLVTVDAPRLGKRDADARNRFALPPHLTLPSIEKVLEINEALKAEELAARRARGEPVEDGPAVTSSKFGDAFDEVNDPSLTWEFVAWLKSITKLPVILKGILSPDDARRAVQAGADGIVVSNHGGRQVDTVPATIDVLPLIARAVEGRVPIILDGGVRRGTDVIKALALGAQAVLVGRPMLWALALEGPEGVQRALMILHEEIRMDMGLIGAATVKDIREDHVIPPPIGEKIVLPPSRM